MSKFDLKELPNEILENIFNFLRLEDIKNVTLVCKQFNEVVGSSNKLMNKMILRIAENENDTQLIRSNRNYRKIFMDRLQKMSEILKNFLQKQSNITYMDLNKCDLKASEFYLIMKCVNENIVDFKFDNTRIISDGNITQIEFPKLKSLDVGGEYEDFFGSIINYFYGAKNVKVFSCNRLGAIYVEQLPLFWRFIGSMKNSLKELDLYVDVFQSDAFLANSNQFKLEEFSFECDASSMEISSNIAKFLYSQRSTLKYLCLDELYITQQLFLSMKKLKHLRLFWVTFISSSDQNEISDKMNYSIEHIFLLTNESEENQAIIIDFFKKCVGLKKLELYHTEISFDLIYTLAHYVENLEILSFRGCSFFPMAMPKIKEMTLIGENRNDENVIYMIRLNRQLKKLKLPRSFENNPRCIRAIQEINVADVEFLPD